MGPSVFKDHKICGNNPPKFLHSFFEYPMLHLLVPFCKQACNINQKSPKSVPLLSGMKGTIHKKGYESYIDSL